MWGGLLSLHVRPIELKQANAFIAEHHRHHKPVVGHRFSIACELNDVLVGVAVCGRPVARGFNQLEVLEVTRLCTDGTSGACSCLYAAAARAAQAIGYKKIQTYILESEPGTSLKAAGWKQEATVKGRDWNCPSRPGRRTDQPQVDKTRWARWL